MNEIVDNETGEITSDTMTGHDIVPVIDSGALVSLAAAEINIQIATARRWPRNITEVQKKIKALAILDERTAEECCYALIRGAKKKDQSEENKAIEGPSIRLAEIAFQSYGNARVQARVINVNRKEMYIEAEATFLDLETNVGQQVTERRNVRTSSGRLYSEDMINVTGRAACAIAKRNVILGSIARGLYWGAYEAAREVIAGTVTTLAANRDKVYKAFASYGITPKQIHEAIGVGGEAEVMPDHIAKLRAAYASIKNGEVKIEEVFPKDPPKTDGIKDPLKDPPIIKKTDVAAKDKATDKVAETDRPKETAKTETAKGSPDPKSGDKPAGAVDAGATAKEEAGAAPTVSSDAADKPATDEAAAKEAEKTATAEEAKPAATEAPKAPAAKGKPEPAANPYPDEPSYTKHVEDICAAATTVEELQNRYNSKEEKAHRNQVWVVAPEMTDKWRTIYSKRKKELGG